MQKLAIHKSLLRAHTFLGCDRELCMFLIVIAIIIALTNLSKESFSIAIIFFLTGFLFLRSMAKSDIMLRKVYLRYQKYAHLYAAQAHSYKSVYRG